MQKFSLQAIAAAALVLASSSGFAASPDTGSILVTASVAAVCKLSLSGDMAFGALDPTLAANPTPIDVTATVRCTKNTPATMTIGGSTTGSLSADMVGTPNTRKLGYTLSWTHPTIVGGGMNTDAASFVIRGQIPFAGIQAAVPDSYSGTVSVVVNY